LSIAIINTCLSLQKISFHLDVDECASLHAILTLRSVRTHVVDTRTFTLAEVLVVRIVGPDAATSASVADLSNYVFGGSGDVHNMRSQYYACSQGQLDVQP
jgi:hypothetical protein